jgi:triacylglycerol lipase
MINMYKALGLALLLGACSGAPTQPTGPEPAGQPGSEPTPTLAPAPTAPATPTPPPAVTPTRTVLLIPGTMITGDYFDTMVDRLRQDGFSPIVYEAPDLFTGSLATGAARVAAEVDRVLALTGESRLHIVAECNGGVTTRYYLQVLGGHARVDQVVTFVSAHHGTWESPVGSWVTGFQSLADITPGSPFLTKLNAAPFPTGLKFTSIYSCWDELMIPYDTSVVDGATNVLFCDRKITHFDGFWDTVVYDRILAALQNRAAPNRY